MTERTERDPQRELRILALVGEALELEGEARHKFIDDACREDPSYREDLAELLDEEVEAKEIDFLERPPLPGLAHTVTSILDELTPYEPMPAPTQLGPYRVVQKLGQGGMGSVYLGEQLEPIRRQVALKIIDSIDHPARRRRFAAECQALARLGHPNVAGLYEVGTTHDGHPFVALEWIDGIDINIWCDEHKASIEQRIDLFFDICSGIRHAHEKGILHRDLKPSNVLVTEVDGRPVAKVIDFGIARGFDKPLLDDTPRLTMENQLIGSPAYMSPEAAFGKRDVDTRSDIYSLGLLLYELLVGTLPLDIEKETLTTLLRRMASEIRPAPSDRFLELTPEKQARIAADRGLSVNGLLSHIRGDLDAIVLKAIARERDQRYSTPSELAGDLKKHLSHQPVTARTLSVAYVAGRYLRRQFRTVGFVTLLVIALTAGLVARTFEARRANLEAQRANQEAQRAHESLVEAQEVSNFLVELFELADPERERNGPTDIRELLDLGAERLQTELLDQPLARARLLQTIGNIYTNMAMLESAEGLVKQALEIRMAELAPNHPLVLGSTNQLGIIYRQQNKLDDAEPLLRQVLAARENSPTLDPLAIADALNNLGNLLWSQSKTNEAEVVQRRALDLRQRHLEPGHVDIAESLNNLGVLLREQRRWQECRPLFLSSAQIVAEALGEDHPRYGAMLFNLSTVDAEFGLWPEAEAHARQTVELWQAAYGPNHPRPLMARSRLGYIFRRLGKFADNERINAETLRLLQANSVPPDDPRTLRVQRDLAIAQGEQQQFESAEAGLRQVLALRRATLGSDHPRVHSDMENLGWLLRRRGRYVEAEAIHRQVLSIRERETDEASLSIAATLHNLGAAIADQGRLDEAEPLLRRALAIREAQLEENHRFLGDTLHVLAKVLIRRNEINGARTLLERALDIRHQGYGPQHPAKQETLDLLLTIDPSA